MKPGATMAGVVLLVVTGAFMVGCRGPATAAPEGVAIEVAVARAVAATLTAEAQAPHADLVATQVAAARAAAATLTAEATAPVASSLATPAATIVLTGPERDLGQGLKLVMQETKDDGQAEFGYYVRSPLMVGPEQPLTEPFNRAVDGFVMYALDDFRQGAAEVAVASPGEPDSSIWITHTVTLATEDLVSVLFYVDGYVTGAAHPFHYSYALNYDLNGAQVLGLADLFRPGTDYLGVLSRYALDDLKRQGVLQWENGALPAPENYQRWSISPEGLLISFDEYTVAPGVAGPQSVLVPYAALSDILAPEGPLASLGKE